MIRTYSLSLAIEDELTGAVQSYTAKLPGYGGAVSFLAGMMLRNEPIEIRKLSVNGVVLTDSDVVKLMSAARDWMNIYSIKVVNAHLDEVYGPIETASAQNALEKTFVV